MDTKKYNKEFSHYANVIAEALSKGDLSTYRAADALLKESVSAYEMEKKLEAQLNTRNFGVLNHIFEQELPRLFKTNKKAVREVVKLIKEDKNLLNQFNFYKALKEYNSSSVDSETYLKRLVEEFDNKINHENLCCAISNEKLRDTLIENNVVPSEFIDEKDMSLYEDVETLTCTKVLLSNTLSILEAEKRVANMLNENKKVEDSKPKVDAIREFEENMRDTLTESEIDLVKTITSAREPIAEAKREKLFNSYRDECIKKVDEMIASEPYNDELKGLKQQIESKTYNKETIVEDMAKLLAIRDVLDE
jgi:hypothetical protein